MQGYLVLQLTINGVIFGSLYALLALGWSIIYSTTGVFHFAHTLVVTVAGYAAVLITMSAGMPLALGVIGAVVAAVIVGCASELVVYRPLRKVGVGKLGIFVASLGAMIVGINAIEITMTPTPRALTGFPIIPINIGPITFTSLHVVIVVVTIVIFWLVRTYLVKTKVGKAIRGVSSNPEMADLVGIGKDRIFMIVFAIGSAIAAIAGLLLGLKEVVAPHMGDQPVIHAFIITFLGGVGSLPGALVGGLLIGMIENLSVLWLPSTYKIILTFGVLMLVISIRPRGLFGR